MSWPKKNEREEFEINKFIEAYARLPGSPSLAVVSKREKPDYLVKDGAGVEIGVELTSVYIDDRSVPDVHMQDEPGIVEIPYSKEMLAAYGKR